MAGRLLALSGRAALRTQQVPLGAMGAHHDVVAEHTKAVIGKREIVGFGMNGQAMYVDRADFPMPAIRWREPTTDIKVLQEKEKGDWKKLSKEEKKVLYRASFCQTFAEFKAPTGEWKSLIGLTLFFGSLSIWAYIGMKYFVYNPLPESFSEERQKVQLRRMLDLKMNPVEGISSKWDYEKDDWKK